MGGGGRERVRRVCTLPSRFAANILVLCCGWEQVVGGVAATERGGYCS